MSRGTDSRSVLAAATRRAGGGSARPLNLLHGAFTMLTETVLEGTGTIAAVSEDETVLWSVQRGEMLTPAPAATDQDATRAP